MSRHVLMAASTVPRWAGDALPAFVLEQAAAMQTHDPTLTVELLAPHHAGAATDERLQGVSVHRFRYAWPDALEQVAYPAILPNLRERPWLWLQVPLLIAAEFLATLAACRRRRPAVIWSHWFAPQGIACGLAAAVLGIPHVLTSHSSDVEVMNRVPVLGPWLARLLLGRCAAITAVSRRTADKLLAMFPEGAARDRVAARLKILPMGLDAEAIAPVGAGRRHALRTEWNLAGRRALLYVGRLTAKKGVADLLEAMRTVVAVHPEAVLLVAGEGELRPALEQRAAALGLAAHVRFLGFVGGERKQGLLQAADILAVPSVITADGDAEGLPVSLLEGLSAGLVCVATDASGADDVIRNGEEGFIAPARDPAQLAGVLLRALTLREEERAAMAGRARARATAFDWPSVAAAHHAHLLAPLLPPEAPGE